MQKEILIIPSWKYNDALLNHLKSSSYQDKPICYVTLNKTYHALIALFKKKEINYAKFFFIDTITPTVLRERQSKSCLYIQSPTQLDDFADQLLNSVKLNKINHVVFDSVSSFLVYNNDENALRFFNYVLSFLEKLNVDITITVLEEDINRPAVKQLKMRADRIINLMD